MTDTNRWRNSDDLREAARRRLPDGLFQFIDRGSEDEFALRNNREALQRLRLRSRILRDVSGRGTASSLLGLPVSMPVVVAPTGPAGQVWWRGEIAMARAAQEAGIPCTVSTASTTPLEAIRAQGGGGRQWFQLYMWPDRQMSYEVVDRAQQAGYEALVVTVDSMVERNRPFEARTGFAPPVRLNRRNAWDILTHPRWLLGVMGRYWVDKGMPRYENLPGTVKPKVTSHPRPAGMPKNDSLVWDDLSRLRERWRGPLLVKGITHADDALRALDCGAQGVVVSNHGAVVFDSAVATIDVLPEVVAAVGGRMAVLVDSGFRRGSEVVKALALGADAVMLGRVPLYGLAAAGQPGAKRALDIIQSEILHTLAMVGCTSVDELGAQHVWRPGLSPMAPPSAFATFSRA